MKCVFVIRSRNLSKEGTRKLVVDFLKGKRHISENNHGNRR